MTLGGNNPHEFCTLPQQSRIAIFRCDAVTLGHTGAAGIYGWAQFLLSFHHITLFCPSHNAPGTDWMVYYGTINAFIGDHTAIIYDSFQFTDYLNATFAPWLSAPLPFHPWLYPPTFLLVLLPFACVPFGVS